MKKTDKASPMSLPPIPRIRKRIFDVILSFVLLLPLYLPMLAIAILIRLDSPGPAIFRQVRIGRGGKPFVCYKFRTMTENAPHNVPTDQLKDAAHYVTRVGRFLRRSSLDELPQLFCVLGGDMSLVGPRPLIPQEIETHRLRHQNHSDELRPGITGMAQCHGRDLLDPAQKAALDGIYRQQVGLRTDLRLLWQTLGCVWRGDGMASNQKGRRHS